VRLVFKSELISDAHVEVRVHAPYRTSYRLKAIAIHERASAIYLQLRNDTV
jgi:hypothetical protein